MFASFQPPSFMPLWLRRKVETPATSLLQRSLDAATSLDCAGTEAALRRIGVDAPGWRLRRLEWDDDAWHCTLSLYPKMPAAFDDAVDGSDPSLSRAILDAIDHARRHPITSTAALPAAPHPDPRVEPVWSDNIY